MRKIFNKILKASRGFFTFIQVFEKPSTSSCIITAAALQAIASSKCGSTAKVISLGPAKAIPVAPVMTKFSS